MKWQKIAELILVNAYFKGAVYTKTGSENVTLQNFSSIWTVKCATKDKYSLHGIEKNKMQFLAFVHNCFTRQKWRNIAFTDESRCYAYSHRTLIRFNRLYCKSPQNITQDAQLQLSSMCCPGRAVMTAHGTLSPIMSVEIFIFTPDGIQHTIVTFRFKLLYWYFTQIVYCNV